MSYNFHSTSIVDENADIDKSVIIGPYCIIGPHVKIRKGTELKSNVIISGDTEIGECCIIYPFSVLGNPPQDLKFQGESSKLIIGNNNVIREHVTMNPGTDGGGLITKIGNNCLIMIGAHVAHDCILGNNIILANGVQVGGHVDIGDWVTVGGMTPIHQFTKIGCHSFIGGGYRIVQDIPPYILAMGEPLKYAGINSIGLRRRNFPPDVRDVIKKIYKIIFKSKTNLSDSITLINHDYAKHKEANTIIDFIKNSNRGLI